MWSRRLLHALDHLTLVLVEGMRLHKLVRCRASVEAGRRAPRLATRQFEINTAPRFEARTHPIIHMAHRGPAFRRQGGLENMPGFRLHGVLALSGTDAQPLLKGGTPLSTKDSAGAADLDAAALGPAELSTD